jgi:hypothetical protein
MFNPITNSCTENKKLLVGGKCQTYHECSVIDKVSPYGKWVDKMCETGQHFNQETQNCIPSETSTCGNIFSCFLFHFYT